jgi:hypothetical protein
LQAFDRGLDGWNFSGEPRFADGLRVNGDSVAIFSALVGSGAANRNVTVTYSGAAFQNREFYVETAANLSSSVARTHSTGNNQATVMMDVTKGALICAISSRGTSFGPTSGVSTPSVTFRRLRLLHLILPAVAALLQWECSTRRSQARNLRSARPLVTS